MNLKLRMNRIVTIILCILLISSFCICNVDMAYGATTEDGQFQYTVSSGVVKITKYLGHEDEVIIPETIDEYPVEIIGESAFYNASMKSVSGPSIVTIEGHAFANCRKLIAIDFPMVDILKMKDMGSSLYCGPFAYCVSLTEVNLPSVTCIEPYAFADCDNLKVIRAPNLKKIYTSSFRGTTNNNTSEDPLKAIIKIIIPCDLNERMKAKGVYFHSQEAIKPIHDVNSWSTSIEPTCTVEGEKKGTCEVCNQEVTEVIPTAHKYSIYKYNNDAQIGVDGTETASCDYGCGTTDTRTKVGSALSSGGSSSGNGNGGYLPPTSETQKPTIAETDSADVTLGDDGTTATIKVRDNYELVDVLINGVSKGAVTALSGLKTGDVIEIKTKLKEAMSTVEQIRTQLEKVSNDNFKARSKQVKLKSGKKAIKITWINSSGAKFDGVQIFRSTKKNSGYGKKPIFTSKSGKFYNTSVKKGKRYYYKVRGYIELDGVKYYSVWSTKAYRTVK
ncbi:leucine-rich repeat protein [Ihubacter sp. mB4P-1]|uniref:leucine-rich repeat domain-containing protein n=1 Tax=Ihubacter sp. mB4P-1 TaxID=3242370 RepID=UPI003C7CD131